MSETTSGIPLSREVANIMKKNMMADMGNLWEGKNHVTI